jgi:glutamine amidotransferase
MRSVTAVVDYGVGNLLSVTNAMAYLGLETIITGDEREIERVDAVILPGVGAFPDAMESLRVRGLDKVLRDQAGRKPILGICLGMQLLFDAGDEVRECKGLELVRAAWGGSRRRRSCPTSAGTT